MDEFVDIVDDHGNNTGKVCLKSEAHQFGYWHSCIHVWLYTDSGKVLIQKRAANKDTFPNLWDVSVAGHIGAGEQPLKAAKREVLEEVGFEIKNEELVKIGTYKTNYKHQESLIDKEFHHVYITKLTVPLETLKLQIEEVAELKLILMNQLKRELQDEKKSANYAPYAMTYFNMVFNAIRK
ncbi:NUDIX hydrolase [Flavivirga spongiicola]|uniref:NUDIX domain-containing protein n=1 Tax=Flavivirga spongiicola TaxID=421621 RepID=A0ABU7XNL9_9FLAO|nr:NUDIX domain-containing protein [Flavivirga sp. MEBiC05379]MDO5977365.1 NUDIX domain-containing protein [Flavivirga sp. MEBiC05379]